MDDSLDQVDMQILTDLGGLYARMDPTPAGLEDRLKMALTVQALHAEVAELTRVPLAVSRSEDDESRTETITFTKGSISLMVSFSDETDHTICLDGWITRGGARVELQVANELFTVTADAHGRFSMEAVPRGRAHFVVWPNPQAVEGRPIVTPTIDL